MKLLAYQINGQTIGIDIGVWDDAMLSGNTAFMAIADTGSTPTDYVDISSIVNWDAYGTQTTLTNVEIRIEITKLVTLDPTAEEIEILENWGIFIDTDIISGQTGTFWGNFRVEGKLWVETIRRVKQEANIAYVRVDQDSGVAGGNNIAGLGILNPTGATTGYTNLDDIPVYYLGIDNDGVLVAGWSGNTQPVMLGSAGGLTTYNTTNTGTITTSSTSDVLLTGMQLTNIPAGQYFLNFGTSLEHTANSDQIFTNIYVGGVAVTGSEQHWRRGAAQGNVSSTHNYSGFPITLATTSTVEIRWRTDGATASAENPYMSLIKVG
jgi:hypothetical protein